MKSKDLLKIGFIKKHVTEEMCGGDAFDYHCYDIGDECLLISNSSDDCVDGEYYVEFFDHPSFGKTYNIDVVRDLIKIMNRFETLDETN